jgi:hypothetical protein
MVFLLSPNDQGFRYCLAITHGIASTAAPAPTAPAQQGAGAWRPRELPSTAMHAFWTDSRPGAAMPMNMMSSGGWPFMYMPVHPSMMGSFPQPPPPLWQVNGVPHAQEGAATSSAPSSAAAAADAKAASYRIYSNKDLEMLASASSQAPAAPAGADAAATTSESRNLRKRAAE